MKFKCVPANAGRLVLSNLVLTLVCLGCAGGADPSKQLGALPSGSPEAASATPVVEESQVEIVKTTQPSLAPGGGPGLAYRVTITVNRDAILNQEFLYGSDLQYSSVFDSSLSLYNQSLAIGHIPARFRIVGDELQLIADNKRSYPSDVNHPESLLTRYKILGQTEEVPPNGRFPGKPATLTLSGANSSTLLAQYFSAIVNPAAGTQDIRDQWIRSFEYVPNGNYLLQETSVVLADGSVGEFMESVFPRSNLLPSKSFTKFEMNPDDAVGASEGPVARYRMLGGEKIFEGEKAVSYAQHFDIADGTIDYYVTRNIPEEAMKPVGLAVESWNRYFLKMKGFERKVMQFKGRLPEGVRLGDPRYNIINWDNRKVAGAAYESQATDPSTGKQSHTLIYMPAAWLSIGANYWKYGQYSDRQGGRLDGEQGTPETSTHVSCMRNIRDGAQLLSSGRLTEEELAAFPVQLLKQVLFHEVGHALGLAHNFKGSLTFDRSVPTTLFSSSIMDYNGYEGERAAFTNVDTWDGPILEYDRQIISALYNNSADVAATDPVMPACNDAEADSDAGSVDPFCARYDVENNPTLSVRTAHDRIMEDKIAGDVTLKESLQRTARTLGKPESLKSVDSLKNAEAWISQSQTILKGILRFYFSGSTESLVRTVTGQTKSLLVFDSSTSVTSDLDAQQELQMRQQVLSGVDTAANLFKLPKIITRTLNEVAENLGERLAKTPYVQNLNADDARKFVQTSIDKLKQTATLFEEDTSIGLPAVRRSVLSSLKRHARVSYFLGKLGDTQLDIETTLVNLLSKATLETNRTSAERQAAANALNSFRGQNTWHDQLISQAETTLTRERDTATTNTSREAAADILSQLKK